LAIHQRAARAAISFATGDRCARSEAFTKQTRERLRYGTVRLQVLPFGWISIVRVCMIIELRW
jgi:hypothetical protein